MIEVPPELLMPLANASPCAECVAGIQDYDPTQGVLLWPTEASLPPITLDGWSDNVWPHSPCMIQHDLHAHVPYGACMCEWTMHACMANSSNRRPAKRFRQSVVVSWLVEQWLWVVLALVAAPAMVAAYMLGVQTSLLGRAWWVVEHLHDADAGDVPPQGLHPEAASDEAAHVEQGSTIQSR